MFVIPMLFIPFVENAFKHGKKSDGAKIYVRIDCDEQQVTFICKNTKRQVTSTEKTMDRGIGIENIKRRLELAYPNNHTLEITDIDNEYRVKLIVGYLKN
jgi:sensor histidine kinase YesM